jgi:hypothetical protein
MPFTFTRSKIACRLIVEFPIAAVPLLPFRALAVGGRVPDPVAVEEFMQLLNLSFDFFKSLLKLILRRFLSFVGSHRVPPFHKKWDGGMLGGPLRFPQNFPRRHRPSEEPLQGSQKRFS